jgi:hypothetical protein
VEDVSFSITRKHLGSDYIGGMKVRPSRLMSVCLLSWCDETRNSSVLRRTKGSTSCIIVTPTAQGHKQRNSTNENLVREEIRWELILGGGFIMCQNV